MKLLIADDALDDHQPHPMSRRQRSPLVPGWLDRAHGVDDRGQAVREELIGQRLCNEVGAEARLERPRESSPQHGRFDRIDREHRNAAGATQAVRNPALARAGQTGGDDQHRFECRFVRRRFGCSGALTRGA
jgi:hypothetical protein